MASTAAHAVHRDPQTVTEAVWDLCTTPPTTRRQRLQADITELVSEYAGQSIGSVDVGRLVNSLTAVIYENHLFLPPGVMLLLRMLGELEGTAKQLNPQFGLLELIQPYAEAAVRRRLAPNVSGSRSSGERGRGSVCYARSRGTSTTCWDACAPGP
jgi:ubiquinone biosynthesis protein